MFPQRSEAVYTHIRTDNQPVTQITVIELQQGVDIGDNLMPIAAAKIMDVISVFVYSWPSRICSKIRRPLFEAAAVFDQHH